MDGLFFVGFTHEHWHPTTTTFWISDGFIGGPGNAPDLTGVGHALVGGETLLSISTWYIEAFYNRKRRHSTLDMLSLISYEELSAQRLETITATTTIN